MTARDFIRHPEVLRWFWITSHGIRLKAIVNIIIGLVIVGMDFLLIWTTKMCIDIATGHSNMSLVIACGIMVAIGIVNIGLAFSRRWVGALLGLKSQNLMQLRTFSRLMHSVWNGKESLHSGDVMNRLIRDANEITGVITDTLPMAICTLVRLAGAFVFLYKFDSSLACLLMVVAPGFVALSRFYIRRMPTLTREIRDTDSKIQSILQESIQHRMVIKTLEQTDGMVEQLADVQAQLRRQVRHKTLFSSISTLIINFGFSAGYLITFIWGVYRLQAGEISYGTMLAFIQLVGQIQGPFREMTRFVPVIISSLTAAERLQELEAAPLEEEGNPIFFPHGAGIRFRNVYYRYEDGHRNILNNFCHDFVPGSTTAILGETGAGKTTLIRMVLALLSPDEGSVELYDNNQSAQCSPQTRCNLVYVPQGNTLLSGTIRDNLLLGNPEASEEDMIEAIHMACADFILRQPKGLDTPCGEGGAGLSEGQAQRIAIARALLRRGNIILLDEATSALDPETEQNLINNISLLAKSQKRTVLFITHRPAIVDYCNNILKLERKA